jgi:predicted subunit of tRNA(5-methylaminomethyl-2-thiouridylate) methyltransferase
MNDPETAHDPGIQLKLISRKMVHRLNNMLFVIDSYSEFIKEAHTDAETRENLTQIQNAAEQCFEEMENWRAQADLLVPDPPTNSDTL